MAPTSRTPFGGVNLAIVEPLVIDYGLNVPVEGVSVNLLTGPSAPRSDVTDATGKVSFKKLTPNATATCPSDCYDLTASLGGYVQLNSPTRLNVGPGQTAAPTIQIFRPATINLVVRDSGGSPYTGTTSVKLTSARNGATQTFSVSGGSAAITTLAGEQIVPSVQYTAEAWTSGSPMCSTPVTQYVPDNYPTVLTSTMVVTLGSCPAGNVNVTVNWGAVAGTWCDRDPERRPVRAHAGLRYDQRIGRRQLLRRSVGNRLHGYGHKGLAERDPADRLRHDGVDDERHDVAADRRSLAVQVRWAERQRDRRDGRRSPAVRTP